MLFPDIIITCKYILYCTKSLICAHSARLCALFVAFPLPHGKNYVLLHRFYLTINTLNS